jgi:hypothetical protein
MWLPSARVGTCRLAKRGPQRIWSLLQSQRCATHADADGLAQVVTVSSRVEPASRLSQHFVQNRYLLPRMLIKVSGSAQPHRR